MSWFSRLFGPAHRCDAIDVQLRGRASTSIELLVMQDIAARQCAGFVKYGTTVAENPLPLRDCLQHAYEEHLDAAIYLRRAIAEIDAKEARP